MVLILSDKLLKIFNAIKNDFCNLFKYKIKGETLEVITSFPTLNNKFVSIFVTERENKYIITDGGLIDKDEYDIECDQKNKRYVDLIKRTYIDRWEIKSTYKNGYAFYYKTTEQQEMISSHILDLAQFTSSVISSYEVNFERERKTENFSQKVNKFLKSHFSDLVKFNQTLTDLKSINFNAIITHRNNDLSLIKYINGKTFSDFKDSLQLATYSFQASRTSILDGNIIHRIPIINNLKQIEKGHSEKLEYDLKCLVKESSLESSSFLGYIDWSVNKQRLLEHIN